MPQEGIRRLSLADLDDDSLRDLIGHGEDLFVERKQEPPKDGIGRVVANSETKQSLVRKAPTQTAP